jgi:hypothetical protein
MHLICRSVFKGLFWIYTLKCVQSWLELPRSLRCVRFWTSRTFGWQVRIPLKAWMYFHVFRPSREWKLQMSPIKFTTSLQLSVFPWVTLRELLKSIFIKCLLECCTEIWQHIPFLVEIEQQEREVEMNTYPFLCSKWRGGESPSQPRNHVEKCFDAADTPLMRRSLTQENWCHSQSAEVKFWRTCHYFYSISILPNLFCVSTERSMGHSAISDFPCLKRTIF